MLYFVYGSLKTRVKKQVSIIIDSIFKDEEKNVVELDFNECDIFSLIEECNSFSLTSFSKVVVLYNSYFLSTEKSKKKLYPVKTNVVRVNCDCGFYKYFYI